jgi:multiple sugar transport system ATP-binding protein
MVKVSIKNASKTFVNSDTSAVTNVNLDINDKEFLVILGPSGSGKSTLLRLIAGLEELTTGDVYFGPELMNDVQPRDRNISMVFQNFALFPHMTVFDNIAFPLVASNTDTQTITSEVKRIASLLKIDDLLERRPSELSGGEQQRVSLGRAIIKKPQVFLMDEPLSNLDAALRSGLRTEIKKLHEELKITFIYVTHDQTEAMTMADRIAIIKDGKVLQVDNPEQIYDFPSTSWIGSFVGSPPMNIVKAKSNKDSLTIDSQEFNFKNSLSGNVMIGIRPENIKIVSKDEGKLSGTVLFVDYLGDSNVVNIDIENQIIRAKVSDSDLNVGSKTSITFNDDDIILFDDKGNLAK